MPPEFIDNNAIIDRAARRRIRSHVAMGRNAGKTLVRPSKRKLGLGIKNATALSRIPKVVEDTRDSESNEDVFYEIERQVGDGLSVLSIPKHPNPGSTGLVQKGMYVWSSTKLQISLPDIVINNRVHLVFSFINESRYNPELSIALDATRNHTSMWVQFMFLDEACVCSFLAFQPMSNADIDFPCVMAMSVTILNNPFLKQEDPTEAIRHLSQTFRLVNERLSGNDAVSDTTLAVVVVMAQYACLQGEHRQGLVHLEGLQGMIELRGGVSQLTRNEPGLTQMGFK